MGLAVLLGSAVGVTSSIAVLGERIRSREQITADAAPPPPSLLTVAAERRVLEERVTFRATLDPAAERNLTLPAAVTGVVTKVNLRSGATLRAGAVPVEVQGRPVIVLPGAFRYYRDLRPGDQGPDVAQLQRGMAALGYRIKDRRGRFGAGTAAAVKRMYRVRGYSPPAAAGHADDASGPPNASGTADASGKTGAPDKQPSTKPAALVLPVAELWAVPRLPQPVSRPTVRVGANLSGSGTVVATAAVALRLRGTAKGAAAVVRPGMSARVSLGSGGTRHGRVVSLDDAPAGDDGAADSGAEDGSSSQGSGQEGSDGDGTPVVVELSSPDVVLSPDQSYQVTIVGRSSGGPVLAVPLTAVQESPDGSTFVSVRDAADAGRLRQVPVRVGIQVDGWAQVRPRGADLADRSPIVVGVEAAS